MTDATERAESATDATERGEWPRSEALRDELEALARDRVDAIALRDWHVGQARATDRRVDDLTLRMSRAAARLREHAQGTGAGSPAGEPKAAHGPPGEPERAPGRGDPAASWTG
jgi:hypothetical protein